MYGPPGTDIISKDILCMVLPGWILCLVLLIGLIILNWEKYLQSAGRKQEFINKSGVADICTREVKLYNTTYSASDSIVAQL